jgi:hypothetical protein
VFDIIFEEVEDDVVTRVLSIPENDPWFLRAVTLFKRRVQAELDDAIKNTKEAQTMKPSSGDLTVSEQTLLEYKDGQKLSQCLDFTKRKALKKFGKHLEMPSRHDLPAEYSLNEFDSTYLLQDSKLYVVSQDSVKSAEELLHDVHSTQRNAVFTVFKILKPVIPKYLCSLLFMIMARAFEAPLYAHYLPSFKSSIAAINPEATEGEFGHGPTIFAVAQEHAIIFAVGFLLMRPVDFIANSLGDQAACDFAAPLRKAVMQAIMKQDTQYFDFNPTAKLQERLNRDTDELVENLLWMPRNFLQHFFRVCQRGITLYVVAPRMFYACATMNGMF